MTIRYNHASLDYRRVLMPQQQFQAGLNKGMPPQQAMKAAYPGQAGPTGSAPTARPGGPNPAAGAAGPGGGAIEQLKAEARRLMARAKQMGQDAVSEVQKIITTGGGEGGRPMNTPAGRIPTPPQLVGGPRPGMGRPGMGGPGMGGPGMGGPPVGGASPMGGGMRPPGMPQRRPPVI